MLNEILQGLGLSNIDESIGFKCTVLGASGIYIEGIKRVLKFCDTQIILSVAKCKVIISGAKLYIRQLTDSDCIVAGCIEKVEFDKAKTL